MLRTYQRCLSKSGSLDWNGKVDPPPTNRSGPPTVRVDKAAIVMEFDEFTIPIFGAGGTREALVTRPLGTGRSNHKRSGAYEIHGDNVDHSGSPDRLRHRLCRRDWPWP